MDFFEKNVQTGNVLRSLFYGKDIELFENIRSNNSFLSWYYLISNQSSDFDNVGTLSSSFFNDDFSKISFNANKFSDYIGKDLDFDVVFSSKLEHTSFISNLFYNRSRHRPSIISFLKKSDLTFPFTYTGVYHSDTVIYFESSEKEECLDRLEFVFDTEVIDKLECKFESFDDFTENIETLIEQQKRISKESDAIQDIKKKIREEKSITKYQLLNWLNWGRQIAWTPYRRRLLDNSNFSDVVGYEPKYIYTN